MHAVAEFLLQNQDCSSWEKTMVVLGVRDESHLRQWIWKLNRIKKEYAVFREPDIGNQITSLVCVDDGKIFKKLMLI